jgi:hypothetical protein
MDPKKVKQLCYRHEYKSIPGTISDVFDGEHYKQLRTQKVVVEGKELSHRYFSGERCHLMQLFRVGRQQWWSCNAERCVGKGGGRGHVRDFRARLGRRELNRDRHQALSNSFLICTSGCNIRAHTHTISTTCETRLPL